MELSRDFYMIVSLKYNLFIFYWSIYDIFALFFPSAVHLLCFKILFLYI